MDKEVYKTRRQNILEILQERESGLRRELTCIGLELRKEQTQELYQSQQLASRQYRWVEAKEDRLFDILGPSLKSPYMALPTYMLHLKQSIWLYYHVHSHISWQIPDEELYKTLYEEYLLYHSEISRQLALRILQRVKRSQEEQCIGYIAGKQRVHDSLYVLLQHAHESGEITRKRREYLLKQCEQLAQELVFLLNHKQSTSLSTADHKCILSTTSYVVLQGLEEVEGRSLQEPEIGARFKHDLFVLQGKKQQARNLLNQLRRNRLPFCNERHNSVMDEQISHYLEQPSTYEGILYYSYTTEDLDYPLVDGIPLFHDMYHLDGMDLVLYYVERFTSERTFCEYFREELPEFLRRYEL